MASDTFGFLTDQSTLWAVVLGAILATIGGFVATVLERTLDKREREQNAALFFGEVLSTLAIILSYAEDTKKIGDPFGPITMRMLRSARGEIDIYDRNRESLFDLRDAELRARIQTLIIRMVMPLDGIIEATVELATLQAQLKSAPAEDRDEIAARLGATVSRRDGAYEFMQETAAQLKGAIAGLEPLAHHSFQRIADIVRST